MADTTEHLKGQITALQNVISMLIAATPNSDALKGVIHEVSKQVAPTLDEAHPSFKEGWLSVIAAVCQVDEADVPGKDEQH